METRKLKSIEMSMMKIKSDINKNNKASYIKKNTAKFTVPSNFFSSLSEYETEELASGLVNNMREDLLKTVSFNEVDSIGLWVEYDGKRYENAISLKTLNEMKKFGTAETDPMYEFFKMTLNDIYYSPIAGDE